MYTIRVTQDDIYSGKRGCGKRCAVARAVKREFSKKGLCPYVESDGSIFLYKESNKINNSFKNPHDYYLDILDDGELADVQSFIYNFDEVIEVKPMQFKVELIEEVNK